MHTVTATKNHAAAQLRAWPTPVMAPSCFSVSGATCTKIRPVKAPGDPFRGDCL